MSIHTEESLRALSDRDLDALAARAVMGWSQHPHMRDCWATSPETPDGPIQFKQKHYFCPSTSIADAWLLVEAVQKQHEGWRFSLLGGDRTMGYRTNADGSFKTDKTGRAVVDETSRFSFGWKAEFFGEVDPRQNYGDRHASVYSESETRAIVIACILASQENPK